MSTKKNNKKSLNEWFLDECKFSEEQKKDFIELYNKFYQYVYEYEVGYPEDFKFNDPDSYTDMGSFEELLNETGLGIKVREGY